MKKLKSIGINIFANRVMRNLTRQQLSEMITDEWDIYVSVKDIEKYEEGNLMDLTADVLAKIFSTLDKN